MRKLLVLPIVLTAFCAGFDVSAAVSRGGRGSSGNTNTTAVEGQRTQNAQGSGTTAARTANRNRANPSSVVTGTTSARVATRKVARSAVSGNTTAVNNTSAANVKRTGPVVSASNTSGGKAARAAKQSAVNLGTKVKAKAENTIVSKECQDAFYGCMDSLCMMDNASGGRCRCDDRVADFDAALELIMEANTKTEILRTEAVQRIEMGEDADVVAEWAEKATAEALADYKKNKKDYLKEAKSSTTTKKTLDFSSLNNILFDTDSLFDSEGEDSFQISDLANKTGSALRSAAMQMCGPKLPETCNTWSSMLTAEYSRQIESDCTGYYNDLRKRQMEAETESRKALAELKDVALDKYREQNKYRTAAECAIYFNQCMQGESVCGAGFESCVVNPTYYGAAENRESAIMHPISTKKGGVAIEITESTYREIEGRKGACESVLRQCIDVSKDVWNEFLVMAAATIKSAELAAEDDVRRNCARDIVDCVKQAAADAGKTEGTDDWAYFTQDINNFKETCKIEIDKCKAYGSDNLAIGVENYIRMALDALRVDRCTTKIKTCLINNCGEDFSGCPVTSAAALYDLCSDDEIAYDCAGKKGSNGEDIDLTAYVNSVAQGLMLNVNSKLIDNCQKAVKNVMTEYCGGTDICQNDEIDFSNELQTHVYYRLVRYEDNIIDDNHRRIKNDISAFSEADATCPKWEAKLWNTIWHQNIRLQCTDSGCSFKDVNENGVKNKETSDNTGQVVNKLNNVLSQVTSLIMDDIRVKRCTDGFKYENFDGAIVNTHGSKTGESTNSTAHSSNQGRAATVRAASNVYVPEGGPITYDSSEILKKAMAANKFKADTSASRSSASGSASSGGTNTYDSTKTTIENYTTNMTRSMKKVIANAVFDEFIAQFNARKSELQSDIESANGIINKAYSDAGRVCPTKTSSGNGGDGTTDDVVATGNCKLGDCQSCSTASQKCKCIAITYFQNTHVKHNGNSKGEVTMLGGATMDGNNCKITYRRHASCSQKDASGGDGGTGWDCGTHDNIRMIEFTLKDDSTINLSAGGCSAKTDYNWVAYSLEIDNQNICFDQCTDDIYLAHTKDKEKLFDFKNTKFGTPIASDAVWCKLDDMEDNNGSYIKKHSNKEEDPITGRKLKHSYYLFFSNIYDLMKDVVKETPK